MFQKYETAFSLQSMKDIQDASASFVYMKQEKRMDWYTALPLTMENIRKYLTAEFHIPVSIPESRVTIIQDVSAFHCAAFP